MGRKSKRKSKDRKQKLDNMFSSIDEDMAMVDMTEGRRSAKERSKLKRKEQKKMRKQIKNLFEKQKRETGNKAGWYKILIKGDKPLEKGFILSSIAHVIDTEFRPLGFYRIDKTSCFYLENNEPAATAIAGLNRRLQSPDGSRLKITSDKCDGPDLVLNSDQLQVLRECLSRRYDVTTCLLNLSDLHNDPVLLEKDILTPLLSPSIMKQVLKLIKENVPQLKALNLSKNSLRKSDLNALQSLQSGSSQLAALNLEHNNLCDLRILNLIKMFPLTELSLQFNPIVDSYKDKPVAYIKEVKARLSSLKLLDGVDIDKYLTENDKPVLQSQKMNINFSKNEKIMCSSSSSSEFEVTESTVRTFLDQYYALIDTPERSNLVAAYTPDAVLEVKSNVNFISSNVFVGHEKINEALVTLPATQHQHNSFSLNIQPLGPKTTQAEVTGQCKVAGTDSLVAFLRTMNIVPFNTGFCCSQDKLELKLIGA